jgi:hypothetical protein
MQTAGHGKYDSSGNNGDREAHTAHASIMMMIDYKMVNTNVFLILCSQSVLVYMKISHRNFSLRARAHTHTLDHINLFTPKMFPKIGEEKKPVLSLFRS